MERIELKISAPIEKLDPNYTGWDEESFYLREHLFDLINSYGYEQLMDELLECKRITQKKSNVI